MAQRKQHERTSDPLKALRQIMARPLVAPVPRAGRAGWMLFTGALALIAGIVGGLVGMAFLFPVPQTSGAQVIIGRVAAREGGSDQFPALAPLAAAVVDIVDIHDAVALADRHGRGVVLTSDGWVATLRTALPTARGSAPGIVARDRTLHAVTEVAYDPMSDLAFLRVPTLSATVVPIRDRDGRYPGMPLFAPTEDAGLVLVRLRARSVREQPAALQSSDRWGSRLTFDGSTPLIRGTPLVDEDGAVVALVLADDVALPVDAMVTALASLFRDGAVTRNALGVMYRDRSAFIVDDTDAGQGAIIEAPPRGRAFTASSPLREVLEEGDRIIAVGDDPLTERRFLEEILQEYPLGAVITLSVLAEGEAATHTVTLTKVTGETVGYP
ncbi:MAG: S1C family serine protease [bacterium]|nr:S1C family serine protease [bacterium]